MRQLTSYLILKDKRTRVASIAVVFALLTACAPPPDDEAMLRKILDEMEQAVEKKQGKDFLRHVAEDFRGQKGSMDKRGVRRLLLYHFVRHKGIEMLITSREFNIKEATAKITLQVGVAGLTGIVPERAQYYDVQLFWRKEGDVWRLSGADWQSRL